MGSNQSTTGGHCLNTTAPKKRSGVLLRGCETEEEHKFTKTAMIEMLRPLKGEEGLVAIGMEYRFVTLQEDGELVTPKKATTTCITKPATLVGNCDFCECQNDDDDDNEEKKEENTHRPLNSQRHFSTKKNERRCPCATNYKTMTRLFHKESNTMITMKNRKEFIADGVMYDIICRLAMEYSQEVMIRDGQLEWVDIAADIENQSEPIRALMSTRLVEDESRLDNEPTLLIATGNGSVRAGVFSRQHLLTSGLECSSAVQYVSEAYKRNINVIVIDPNVHGDRFGMVTFEKSMMHLFRRWEEKKDISSLEQCTVKQKKNLYVLSHSHSGSQFVRYLLNKAEWYLPHIRAIAFTDSTHNIQWTKRKNQEALKKLLESDECIYFKRSDQNIDHVLNPLSSIGEVVDTDEFWKHRFGKIQTLCAGTSEHSLTNWFPRNHIWDHFDLHLAANY